MTFLRQARVAPGEWALDDLTRWRTWGELEERVARIGRLLRDGLGLEPDDADVAVFGVPDEEWGESIKAAVELADGYPPSADLGGNLMAFVRDRLAGYKVPRSIDFEPRLPRHPTGKLHVRELRAKYWRGRSRSI